MYFAFNKVCPRLPFNLVAISFNSYHKSVRSKFESSLGLSSIAQALLYLILLLSVLSALSAYISERKKLRQIRLK
jgi:hypothetical protein